MSEEKCEYYLRANFYNSEGQCSNGYSRKMCADVSDCYYKQLQTAKEEIIRLQSNDYFYVELDKKNELLTQQNKQMMEQLNTKYLEWEETFMENQNLTQQNKTLNGALKCLTKKFEDFQKIDYSQLTFTERQILQGDLNLLRDIIQQNKQMREALEKIVLIYPKYNRCINNNWKGDGDGSMCKHCNTNDICPHLIAQQALKGME